MATYTVDTMPSELSVGDVINCDYSGAAKSCTLQPGQYKLECWGACGTSGGSGTGYGYGKGGYSVGNLKLKKNTVIYVYSGGAGANGSFNGGGRGTATDSYKSYGGGGSDIRIGTNSLYARVIVAGGGGGDGSGSPTVAGGAGGGISGIAGSINTTSYGEQCTPGTQTSGGKSSSNYNVTSVIDGSFGQGGYINGSSHTGGGGGGWYGGGAYGPHNGNSGGSGYVYTSSTASNYPSGCLLNSSYYLTDAQTIAGNTSFPSTSGGTETGHSGNGYVRITVISVGSAVNFRSKINSTWIDSDGVYVKINGSWREAEFVYMRINGSWSEAT